MKRNYLLHFLALALAWVLSVPLSAAKIDEKIYYSDLKFFVTSLNPNKVGLASFANENNHPEHLEVPGQVTGSDGTVYTVTKIFDYSFCSDVGITSLSLAPSVTEIESSAFAALTTESRLAGTLDLSHVTTLSGDGGAFRACSNLEKLILGKDLTSIAPYSFTECSGFTGVLDLTHVSKLDVNDIGFDSYAFQGCSGFSELILGSNLNEITPYAFQGCTGLKSIDIRHITKFPLNVEGISCAFSGCTGLKEVKCLNVEPISLPEDVFKDVSISDVYLRVSSETVPAYAKADGWREFKIICVEDGLSLRPHLDTKTIEVEGCEIGTSPTSLSIPATVNIGTETNIEAYPVTTLADGAFKGCTSLSLLSVPWAEAPSISEKVFEDLDLSKMTLGVPAGAKESYENSPRWSEFGTILEIGHPYLSYETSVNGDVNTATISGFQAGKEQAELVIPSTIYHSDSKFYTVTTIGAEAFRDEKGITALDLTSTVTTIGYYAFYGCEKIAGTLDLSHVTTLTMSASCSYAFYGCKGLTGLTLGSGIEIIPPYAFAMCTGLANPVDLTHVDEFPLSYVDAAYVSNAFAYCPNIPEIKCERAEPITLPKDVFTRTSVGSKILLNIPQAYVAAYADADTWMGFDIIYKEDDLTYHITDDGTNRSAVVVGYEEGITPTTLSIPSKLAVIPGSEGGAFVVTTIADEAFKGCTSLIALTVPWDQHPLIDPNVFEGLTLEDMKLFVPQGATQSYECSSPWKDFGSITEPGHPYLAYTTNNEGGAKTATITGFQMGKEQADLVIPSFIQHTDGKLYTITTIGEGAFHHKTEITSLNLSSTITTIAPRAFFSCINISGTLDLSHVTTLGVDSDNSSSAFYLCEGLTKLILGSELTHIPAYTFYECSSLEGTLDLSHVTTLGTNSNNDGNTFKGCKELSELILSKELMTIPAHAFQNCSGFKGALDLSHVTTIGADNNHNSYAFAGCNSFTSLTLGAELTTIPAYAFQSCSGLEGTLDLSHVTTLGMDNNNYSSAFYHCESFTKLILGSELRKIPGLTFKGCTALTGILDLTHINEFTLSTGNKSMAFGGCNMLKVVKRLSGLIPLPDDVFSDVTTSEILLIVSPEDVEEYAAAEGWKEFKMSHKIEYSISTSNATSSIGQAMVGTYIKLIANAPMAGYTLVGWETVPKDLKIDTDGGFFMPESNVQIKALYAPITDIATPEKQTTKIYAHHGTAIIEGGVAKGTTIYVHSTTGALIKQYQADGSERIELALPTGTYLITVAQTTKLIIL